MAAKVTCDKCSKKLPCVQLRAGGKQYSLCEGCYGCYLDVKDRAVAEATMKFIAGRKS